MKEVCEFDKIWREIPGRDGYYASKDGDILSFSKSKDKPRILSQMKSRDGHRYVFTYCDGKNKKLYVHRAVLLAWVGPPGDKEECRHLNDKPEDNRLENLCWGTREENARDCIINEHRPRGEDVINHKLTEEQVLEIRRRYEEGESSRDLAQDYGVASNTITLIARGKKWSHLPTAPNQAKHSSTRKTPNSEEEKLRSEMCLRRYAESRRKERKIVPCACGCGMLIETPDNNGRERKYVHGHNQKGKNWRWSK